jgi:hypothetical protein
MSQRIQPRGKEQDSEKERGCEECMDRTAGVCSLLAANENAEKRRWTFVASVRRRSHLANVAIFAERRFVSICESISLAKRENRFEVIA